MKNNIVIYASEKNAQEQFVCNTISFSEKKIEVDCKMKLDT